MNELHDDPIVAAAFKEAEKHLDASAANIIIDSESNNLDELLKAKDRIAELEFALSVYRDALRTSFEEVAKIDKSFSSLLEEQKLNLSDWILTAKAARELCFIFGNKLSLSLPDIKSLLVKKKIELLYSDTDPFHGNKLPKSIIPYKQVLESKCRSALENKEKEISELHDKGIFVKSVDYKKSWHEMIEEWHRDSEQNNPNSLYNLGVVFRDSYGGLLDLDSSISYFKRASEVGVGDASFALYRIFSNYQSTYFNDSLAADYLSLAKSQGSKLVDTSKNKDSVLFKKKNHYNNLGAWNEHDLLEGLKKINGDTEKVELQKLIAESLARKYSWSYLASVLHGISVKLTQKRDGVFFSKSHSYDLHFYNKMDDDVFFTVVVKLSDGSVINKNVSLKKNSDSFINIIKALPKEIILESVEFTSSDNSPIKQYFGLAI